MMVAKRMHKQPIPSAIDQTDMENFELIILKKQWLWVKKEFLNE
jgi:hypothetical protein